MEAMLLQDFITARGTSGGSVIQPRYRWLDLGDTEDIVIYLDVREALTFPSITFQTAPAAEESAFVNVSAPIPLNGPGLTTLSIMARFAQVPPARYLRWKLSGNASTWDATFRAWVAGYALA